MDAFIYSLVHILSKKRYILSPFKLSYISLSSTFTLMDIKGYTQDGTVDIRGRPILASKSGKWKACAFLIGYEVFERMCFYGIASNLVNYLTTQLHEDTVSSVRNVNNWSGVVWITPILGAYIADTYLGRFWTFTISSLVYVLGMVMLTTAASLKSLKTTCATNNDGSSLCTKAGSSVGFFYLSLYVIAIGSGGTKPNISTFGADQFDELNPVEKKRKASFFNWWMFSSFLGGLIANIGLVYIQENVGWGLGYGIPTIGLLMSLFLFYIGTPIYRHKLVSNVESPAKHVWSVLVAAFRNRKLMLPEDPSELHVGSGKRRVHHSSSMTQIFPLIRCLDKAAILTPTKEGNTKTTPPCTVTQTEETKLIMGMLVIWLVTLIPSTLWAQINTLFVKQGTTLDRTIGAFQIPAASLGSFIQISMLITLPFYDRVFVPFMRTRTGNPRGISLLQRLGVGFLIQIAAVAVAYAVEVRRMRVVKTHLYNHHNKPNMTVPMSIFWLLPQYVLLGIGDVFNAVGLMEFFYDQSPEEMRSLGTTFFTSGIGVGNFLNSFLVTVVDKATAGGGGDGGGRWIGNDLNESRLDYYYGFLLVLSGLNLGAFVWASSWYVYKKEEVIVMDHGAIEDGK
ncbi:Protein NRT1/ PTR FAMILY 5.1 [Linum perenne]